jgi:hypothetical protein
MNKNINLIILDWDDTLFPTSWLTINKININEVSINQNNLKNFYILDDILSIFLLKLTKYGHVVIITNAMLMWIKVSLQVLPKTTIVLNDVTIISARDKYKSQSSKMMDWKKLAFKNYVKNYDKKYNIKSVISIGDADFEYFALIELYKTCANKKLKSIKLLSKPRFEILIDQLLTLNKSIILIIKKNCNLDLHFNIKD